MNESARELIKSAKIEVAVETFALVGLSHEEWNRVLADPAASPRMSVPFMIFKDQYEVTLMLDETDLESVRGAIAPTRIERGFRLLTFDVVLEFTVAGFLAEIAGVLAAQGIPIVAVSSYSRDHLLIKQDDLARALLVLGGIVQEVC
jgi:hypothetical protein